MKKHMIAIIALAVALLGGAYAATVGGGSASNPLISRNFADGDYAAKTLSEADSKAAQRYDALYRSAESGLMAKHEAFAARLGRAASGTYHGTFADVRLKKGDAVTVNVGSGFRLLAGTATVSYPGGAVVDVTMGSVQPTGPLSAGRRYLVGENTTATIAVTSPTAVLSLEGYHVLTASGETDFNALADAMKTLGLLKGSDTGYGSGYDLEQPPTRIQGLIMFLRLLGEERDALATTAVNPFRDVAAWAAPYVAYAYEQGYTRGVDALRFGSDQAMGAADFVTFVLRALRYQDSGAVADFSWSTSLEDARRLGILTAGEHKMLAETPFLRAHAVYLSYFALDATNQNSSETLQAMLVASGTFDQIIVDMVRNGVAVRRLP